MVDDAPVVPSAGLTRDGAGEGLDAAGDAGLVSGVFATGAAGGRGGAGALRSAASCGFACCLDWLISP